MNLMSLSTFKEHGFGAYKKLIYLLNAQTILSDQKVNVLVNIGKFIFPWIL